MSPPSSTIPPPLPVFAGYINLEPPLVAILLMVPSISFFTIKAHNDQVDSAFWFGAPNYNYQTDA
jgi:hypothetical protein